MRIVRGRVRFMKMPIFHSLLSKTSKVPRPNRRTFGPIWQDFWIKREIRKLAEWLPIKGSKVNIHKCRQHLSALLRKRDLKLTSPRLAWWTWQLSQERLFIRAGKIPWKIGNWKRKEIRNSSKIMNLIWSAVNTSWIINGSLETQTTKLRALSDRVAAVKSNLSGGRARRGSSPWIAVFLPKETVINWICHTTTTLKNKLWLRSMITIWHPPTEAASTNQTQSWLWTSLKSMKGQMSLPTLSTCTIRCLTCCRTQGKAWWIFRWTTACSTWRPWRQYRRIRTFLEMIMIKIAISLIARCAPATNPMLSNGMLTSTFLEGKPIQN